MERIIKVIEEKLKEQDSTIAVQQWQISDLKKKLEEAEDKLAEANGILGEQKEEIERLREHETV